MGILAREFLFVYHLESIAVRSEFGILASKVAIFMAKTTRKGIWHHGHVVGYID